MCKGYRLQCGGNGLRKIIKESFAIQFACAHFYFINFKQQNLFKVQGYIWLDILQKITVVKYNK